jgi:hypothetical protein
VFRCDACGEPIFLKFTAKNYTPLRIELAANYTEIERARENFPADLSAGGSRRAVQGGAQLLFGGCYNAFGAMSRRTAQSLFRELGERGKLELFDTLQEIRSSPNSTTTPSRFCARCCSAATATPGRISPISMPSAPAFCSK